MRQALRSGQAWHRLIMAGGTSLLSWVGTHSQEDPWQAGVWMRGVWAAGATCEGGVPVAPRVFSVVAAYLLMMVFLGLVGPARWMAERFGWWMFSCR